MGPPGTEMLRLRSLAAVTTAARQIHSTPRLSQIYDSILDTIGNTPVVRLNNLSPREDVTVYAKCEYFNPMSSVKDRLAIGVIEEAERIGALKPGQTVVEATSGNTGIAVAMVCAQKGYPCVITMAESFSVERRKLMRALGAKVVLTPASERGTGMVKKAAELAAEHGWFSCDQFVNEANPQYHAQTTGPEIIQDFAGKRLDYWVTGYGTGGTFAGAGKMIKLARPDTRIVLCEPELAQIVGSGVTNEEGVTHPNFTPHPIQGWTPDFVPKVLKGGLDSSLYDDLETVTGDDAIQTSLALSSKEGIFTGISGGGTMAVALKMAKTAPADSVFLVMLPDTGERYLSTPLFAGIEADMSEDELNVSTSTPGFQL